MTKIEKLLASKMLKSAADHFSNHGCNDYEIDDTPEHREWLIAGELANDKTLSREEAEKSITVHEGKLLTMDWLLMARLAKTLKSEIEDGN